jgi:hypothetical protein
MRILQYKLNYKYSAEAIQTALNEVTIKLTEKEIYIMSPKRIELKAL